MALIRAMLVLLLAGAGALGAVYVQETIPATLTGPQNAVHAEVGEQVRVTVQALQGGAPMDLAGYDYEYTAFDAVDGYVLAEPWPVTILDATNGTMIAVFTSSVPLVGQAQIRRYDATTHAYAGIMSWDTLSITNPPGPTYTVDLGPFTLATTNTLSPGAPSGTVATADGEGGVRFMPQVGGGGQATGQVNRLLVGTNVLEGDVEFIPAGLLKLSPTNNALSVYVGAEDIFAGLQSYPALITNVSASILAGLEFIPSPAVAGYQITYNGAGYYLGADAAGTAISTNAIYQIGHNGSYISPLNTLIFGGAPISIAAVGGGTGAVYVADYTNNNYLAISASQSGGVNYAAGVAKSTMPTNSTSIAYYGQTNLIDQSTWEYIPGVPGVFEVFALVSDGSATGFNFTPRVYRNGVAWWPMMNPVRLGGALVIDSGNATLRSETQTFWDSSGTNRWSLWLEFQNSLPSMPRVLVEWKRIGDYVGALP